MLTYQSKTPRPCISYVSNASLAPPARSHVLCARCT